MKSVNAKMVFQIVDQDGTVKATTTQEYIGLDYQQLLFVERHLLAAFQGMNAEADAFEQQQRKGK